MERGARLRVWLVLLAAIHFIVLWAGFFAPYASTTQNRDLPLAPPMPVHFVDAHGHFHFRPFVYSWRPGREAGTYEEDPGRPLQIYFLVAGERYKLVGILDCQRHLFGVDNPGRFFLLGSDEYGRDQFSRLLYGGQISLFAGALATGLSLLLGLVLGGLAGFCGRGKDEAIMRAVELFMALPWLYLLFAIRGLLPLHITPFQAFLLLVLVIGAIGWARPARLIRGVVLSAKERNYVLAARGFGASDFYLLRRHILPETFGVLFTQAALLVPQYVLAEVTLSLFGLGVGEPRPTWGNMLASVLKYYVLENCWWMIIPAIALVPVFLIYHELAGALQARLKRV